MALSIYGRGISVALDEGTVTGSPSEINFAGAGVSSAISGKRLTVTISGGGGGGGGGDVVGPGLATDNAVVRWDTTDGYTVQNSLVTIGDTGNIALAALATIDGRDPSVDGAALDAQLPTADQKAALAGTAGAPNVTNPYVTDQDARLADQRAPEAHAVEHQHGGSDEIATATAAANSIPKTAGASTLAIGWIPTGSTSSTVCIGDDSRLSNARTPTTHASSHKGGGSDVIDSATTSLAGLMSSADKTKLDACVLNRRDLGSVEFDDPNSADWTVNAFAAQAADTVNAGLTVRRFDDTTQEGVGWDMFIPAGTTSLDFKFISRCQSGTGDVVPKLYHRTIADAGAVGSWSAGVNLTTIGCTTSFQYDSQSLTLSGLSLTAGTRVQFEMTRIGTDGSDTLSGDWTLLSINIACV